MRRTRYIETYRQEIYNFCHSVNMLNIRSCEEVVAQRCSVKDVFLEILENSQKYTKNSQMNFEKFVRTPFLT